MSVSLKGRDETVINMGNVTGYVYDFAVLHGECGSSGKTNKLIVAWCDVFHISIACSNRMCLFCYDQCLKAGFTQRSLSDLTLYRSKVMSDKVCLNTLNRIAKSDR